MRAIVILAMLFVGGSLPGAPAVRVLRAGESGETTPVFHVWSGQAVELALEIAATDPDSRMNVRASLYQLAGAIAAPLAANLPVAQELGFQQSLARVEMWKVTPPEVRRVTAAELRFAAQTGPGGNWLPAGSARLVIYPTDLGEQIEKLVADAEKQGAGRLAIVGKSEQLKSALRGLGVAFEELGEAWPEQFDPALIYLGEGAPREFDALSSRGKLPARLIVFVNDPPLLPGVYWTDHDGGFFAKVTLPLWRDFAQSPQRQAAFFELLQRAYRTPPHTP